VLPSPDKLISLHKKYAPNVAVFNLVYTHCQIVAEIALWCAGNVEQEVDRELLKTAALLHDIGAYVFFSEDGKNLNQRMYPLHAVLSARIIADEGIDERVSELVSTHVLLGLTKQEIIDRPWILPERDYEPTTTEGRLLCYADRFHSKHPTFNSFESFINRLNAELPLQAAKFEAWSKEFGIPNVEELAKKYQQPIR